MSRNFLSGRFQQVVVNNSSSNRTPLTSGVPQGTVLGLTLFLVYINDISQGISPTVRLFADDCVLYRPIVTDQDQLTLQRDLEKLTEWAGIWSMEFNVKKCSVIHFHTTKVNNIGHYYMKGETLESVQHQQYLGVELSDNLKFNHHIDKICGKASSILGFLKRIYPETLPC